MNLTTKSVQGTSLAFQGIDDIHGSDCLPLGMLGVGDGVTDDILKEYLEHTIFSFSDRQPLTHIGPMKDSIADIDFF